MRKMGGGCRGGKPHKGKNGHLTTRKRSQKKRFKGCMKSRKCQAAKREGEMTRGEKMAFPKRNSAPAEVALTRGEKQSGAWGH